MVRAVAYAADPGHGTWWYEEMVKADNDLSYRRRYFLPRDGPCLPRTAVAHQIRTIPRDQRCARLRGGAVADAGELVLGATRSGEDVEPLRDEEAVVGRAY